MGFEKQNLRPGEIVEVRSLEEILSTLDGNGTLESLPFMPEMTRYCGQKLTVYRRSDRVCVEGYRARGMKNTVFLVGARCDGSLHDDCQAQCNIFWKEAWLKRPGDLRLDLKSHHPNEPAKTYDRVENKYFCHSTQLHKATSHLTVSGNIRTYAKDIVSGNFTLLQLVRALMITLDRNLRPKARERRRLCGDVHGKEGKTPTVSLGLQRGDIVEFKTREEIRDTLDHNSRNKGMLLTPEFTEHFGKRYRVDKPVTHVIDEQSGTMRTLKNTVTLETVTCNGMCKRACPRNTFLLVREIWLKKVESHNGTGQIPGSTAK